MTPHVWPPSCKPYRANPPDGTVAIVLPIRDNLKFFKLAFHSILDFTDHRFMLTLVDNMSLFSTRQYLESIRRNHAVNVLQYQQPHAQGAEWNLGLRFMFAFTEVQYGVVLTPDVVVEPNWLSRLVRTLTAKPQAILSPYSNAILEARTIHPEAAAQLSPFCTAFNRASYERLGGFDETFHEAGPCTQDFGDRARKAGFRLLSETSVYLHHFERAGQCQDPEHVAQDEALRHARRSEVPA